MQPKAPAIQFTEPGHIYSLLIEYKSKSRLFEPAPPSVRSWLLLVFVCLLSRQRKKYYAPLVRWYTRSLSCEDGHGMLEYLETSLPIPSI